MKKLESYITDYFDPNIDVFDLDNGSYLIRDSKENIQFKCTKHSLTLDIIHDESFFQETFYNKINFQNNQELEGENDPFYISCLLKEVTRIIEHCQYSYQEFLNLVD